MNQLKRQYHTIYCKFKHHKKSTAEKEHLRYQLIKSNCGADSKETVQEKLSETWSLEQIINCLSVGKLSFKTIYRWIYNGRQKGKCQKPQETFGHHELDTAVSVLKQTKRCAATFIGFMTRWYIAILILDCSSSSMEIAVKSLHNMLPKSAM